MVADLREMLENQWVSEIRIDKSRFVLVIILLLTGVVKHLTFEAKGGTSLRSASSRGGLFLPLRYIQRAFYRKVQREYPHF